MLPRLLLCTAFTLLLADSALATTVSVAPGGVLQVSTSAGEENVIVIERDAAAPVLVKETGAPLAVGAGCQDRPDLGAVLCLGVSALDVDTGDRDDRVTLVDAEGFPDELAAKVAGGDGADVLAAGESTAELLGGQGDDTLTGGLGDDDLAGGAGADTIAGGAGTDAIEGGEGDDTLDGGAGFDTLSGGDGADSALYADAAVHVVALGGDGDDRVAGDIERVGGGPVADTFTGTAAAERLEGGDGADILRGEGGDDALDGGSGADQLVGGPGADTVDAGDGDDTVEANDGTIDAVACGSGDDGVTADVTDTVAADCERVVRVPLDACGVPPTAAVRHVSCSPYPCSRPGVVRTPTGCIEPPNPCGRASDARVIACAPPPSAFTLTLGGRRRQAAGRRIAVTVRCSVACSARAKASVKARGRRHRLSAPLRSVPAGRTVTLRLRTPRALAGRRVTIVVTARDRTGRTATARRTVRLR
jgi:hypothetical protein